ncbi:MAG: rhodanese-like domain-containing protein, partial [Bacteroidia bacterium]|nr:rhodanese-like domain-containing protein [Bacteroidia bacterium]
EPRELATVAAAPTTHILDVRNANELANGTLAGALHIPLAELEGQLQRLDPSHRYLVHCAGGYRSMMAASLLQRAGYGQVANVLGGMSRIKADAPALVHQPVLA